MASKTDYGKGRAVHCTCNASGASDGGIHSSISHSAVDSAVVRGPLQKKLEPNWLSGSLFLDEHSDAIRQGHSVDVISHQACLVCKLFLSARLGRFTFQETDIATIRIALNRTLPFAAVATAEFQNSHDSPGSMLKVLSRLV